MFLVVFQYMIIIQEPNGISGNYFNFSKLVWYLFLLSLLKFWTCNIVSNFLKFQFLFNQREGCADTHICDQELGLHILWELEFLLKVSGESRAPIKGTFS